MACERNCLKRRKSFIFMGSRVGNSLIGLSSESLVFCEWKSYVRESLTVALLLWATWTNRSGHSFVKSDLSKSLKWLFKKEQMSEDWRARKLSKTYENTSFLSVSLFFASDLLHSLMHIAHANISAKSIHNICTILENL